MCFLLFWVTWYLILGKLGLSFFAENINVHLLWKLVLLVNFNLRLRSVLNAFLLLLLSLCMLLLNFDHLFASLANLIGANDKSSATEAAENNQYQDHKHCNETGLGRFRKSSARLVSDCHCAIFYLWIWGFNNRGRRWSNNWIVSGIFDDHFSSSWCTKNWSTEHIWLCLN